MANGPKVAVGNPGARTAQLRARERILKTALALYASLARAKVESVDDSAITSAIPTLRFGRFPEYVLLSSDDLSIPANHVAVSGGKDGSCRLAVKYVIREGEKARGIERATLWMSGCLDFDGALP